MCRGDGAPHSECPIPWGTGTLTCQLAKRRLFRFNQSPLVRLPIPGPFHVPSSFPVGILGQGSSSGTGLYRSLLQCLTRPQPLGTRGLYSCLPDHALAFSTTLAFGVPVLAPSFRCPLPSLGLASLVRALGNREGCLVGLHHMSTAHLEDSRPPSHASTNPSDSTQVLRITHTNTAPQTSTPRGTANTHHLTHSPPAPLLLPTGAALPRPDFLSEPSSSWGAALCSMA